VIDTPIIKYESSQNLTKKRYKIKVLLFRLLFTHEDKFGMHFPRP
jgi:hypothetical protein